MAFIVSLCFIASAHSLSTGTGLLELVDVLVLQMERCVKSAKEKDCTASMQKALVACGLHHYILKCLALYKEAEFDEVIIIINFLKLFPCQFIADVLCMVYLYYTVWAGERNCIVFISCRPLGASTVIGS